MQDTPKPLKKGYKFPIYPNAALNIEKAAWNAALKYDPGERAGKILLANAYH